MIRPHVFRGLWCKCGDRHYQEAAYYVSVFDKINNAGDARYILALGPFQEHDEALARVKDVNREVCEHWNPDGRADWYGYGTAVVHGGSRTPGKLNSILNMKGD